MKGRFKAQKKGFPVLPFLLLVLGLVWLVEPSITGVASAVITPILLMLLAIMWLISFYRR